MGKSVWQLILKKSDMELSGNLNFCGSEKCPRPTDLLLWKMIKPPQQGKILYCIFPFPSLWPCIIGGGGNENQLSVSG